MKKKNSAYAVLLRDGISNNRGESGPRNRVSSKRASAPMIRRDSARNVLFLSDAKNLRCKFKLDRRSSLQGATHQNPRTGPFFPVAEKQQAYVFPPADLQWTPKRRAGSKAAGSPQKCLRMCGTDYCHYIKGSEIKK